MYFEEIGNRKIWNRIETVIKEIKKVSKLVEEVSSESEFDDLTTIMTDSTNQDTSIGISSVKSEFMDDEPSETGFLSFFNVFELFL